MTLSHLSHPARRTLPAALALVIALCLLVTTSLTAFANTVRISDPVQVLNVSQVTSAGAKLSYNLDIYTTSTYTGSQADFTTRTISAHLTSPSLIVIAIDTTHRYLAIVGGKNVPLTKDQYTTAGKAFGSNIAGNHYTDATIAAIQSLVSSLASHSSSTSSSPLSGLFILWIIIIIVVLIVIGAIFRFIRRLLGFAPAPSRPAPPRAPTNFGDGRDNLGGGASGTF